MYDPSKYFFDRKIAIPKGMLEDCHLFPMPTRANLENPDAASRYKFALSKKMRRAQRPRGRALAGSPRHLDRGGPPGPYVLPPPGGVERRPLRGQAVDTVGPSLLPPQYYPAAPHDPRLGDGGAPRGARVDTNAVPAPRATRGDPSRAHGHDCIQHAGEMMFRP
ncbi:hypothetical protein ACHAWF_018395 [Thalassiosira exigua]